MGPGRPRSSTPPSQGEQVSGSGESLRRAALCRPRTRPPRQEWTSTWSPATLLAARRKYCMRR
eukprot:10048990-Alexandrium_andersonii.AAC.1